MADNKIKDENKKQKCIIFITHKGKRPKDETKDIKNIAFLDVSHKWEVQYNSGKTFYYNPENVKIIKNQLSDKKSSTVFDYLLQMAEFSEIKNHEGENLLLKNIQKTQFIHNESILSQYLNPKRKTPIERHKYPIIFPFGCNNSQINAVKTALENPISVIQGPPGTGKTQTILNIIANLILANKTVLVVSNNNAATANVYEKLASSQYGMDFICATLGKQENVEDFLRSQSTDYPQYLKDWLQLPVSYESDEKDLKRLVTYFTGKERLAQIKNELSELVIEFKYFSQAHQEEKYRARKLHLFSSDKIMAALQGLQHVMTEKECLGFFRKLHLFLVYGIGGIKFWETELLKSLNTIQSAYYEQKISELKDELEETSKAIKRINPEKIYEKALIKLKNKIATKYERNTYRRVFEDGKELYLNPEEVANEYPVILSTTFSSRATLGYSNDFLFDYVIMDEASQVDVVTGALALSCARNAVIVGDEKQLPNVIEEQLKPRIKAIFEKTGLPEGYSFMHSFLSSLKLVLPNIPQTLLREHYRCHPKIINFCNQQFYNGQLLIMTEDHGEKDVLTAIKTVPGNFCTGRYNQRQIDVIKEEVLPSLTDAEKESLGVIAPYNNQTDEIRRQIANIEASTVHKYQGREKDNIIIFTVDNEISTFSDDPNILNVAITRAKKKLVVILSGNQHPENSNIMALVQYIQYNSFKLEESKLNSIFDFLYKKNTEAKLNFISRGDQISRFSSENAMNSLLKTILSEDKYKRFGYAFEMPLRDVLYNGFITSLPEELYTYAVNPWTHIDFVIFNKITKQILFGIEVDGYTYHKPGSVQAARDKLKNQIFQRAGLPLIRLSTKGFAEEQKIRETLGYFC